MTLARQPPSLPAAAGFLKRLYAEFFADRIPAVAASITFFFLLAIFPAIASVVSLYGMFADRASIARELSLASGFLPGGAVSVLSTELHRLIAQKPEKLNLAFLTGLMVAIWSASGGVSALVDGLNIAYETRETRSFFRLTLNAVIFTLAAIIFAILAINLAIVVPVLANRIGFGAGFSLLVRILVWPAAFMACAALLSVVYRYGPNRDQPWRLLTWGGSTAAVLWIFGTLLFTWYVRNFGSYDRVYGNLGAAVGFLTWIWISLVILLLGAEINCELERSDRKSDVSSAGTPQCQKR